MHRARFSFLAILATFLAVICTPAAAQISISVSQSPNGHIVAHVADTLPEVCSANGTYISPAPETPGRFVLYTNVYCTPPDTRAPYAASVDLGIVADGDYVVYWIFQAGGFGPIGLPSSQSFSIRNGTLVNAILPIPALGPAALLMLLTALGALGMFSLRARASVAG